MSYDTVKKPAVTAVILAVRHTSWINLSAFARTLRSQQRPSSFRCRQNRRFKLAHPCLAMNSRSSGPNSRAANAGGNGSAWRMAKNLSSWKDSYRVAVNLCLHTAERIRSTMSSKPRTRKGRAALMAVAPFPAVREHDVTPSSLLLLAIGSHARPLARSRAEEQHGRTKV